MEKIYMENNNEPQKNSSFKRGGIATMSVVMVVIAVFAFVVAGFDNPAWSAIPEVDSNLGDSFTLKLEDDKTNDTRHAYVASSTTDSGLPVARFWANNNITGTSVFCLEENIGATDGTNYKYDSTDSSASDYGILYILANGYYNKDSFTKDLDDSERAVITQLALWNYLYDKDKTGSSSEYSGYVEKYGIVNGVASKDFYVELRSLTDVSNVRTFTNKIYNNYVSKLVSGAKTASEKDTMPSISKSYDNEVSLTEDKKYYQSSVITVTAGNASTEKFKFKVDDSSPEGIIIVDEDGKSMDEDTEYDVNKKIYVRVPVDSVDDKGADVKLSFTAIGYKYTGKVYKAYDTETSKFVTGQKVIGVNVEKHSTSIGVNVKFDYVPDVPDTGMTTSQILYFIGLVVLVSGVGIIYANIKPKESN